MPVAAGAGDCRVGRGASACGVFRARQSGHGWGRHRHGMCRLLLGFCTCYCVMWLCTMGLSGVQLASSARLWVMVPPKVGPHFKSGLELRQRVNIVSEAVEVERLVA